MYKNLIGASAICLTIFSHAPQAEDAKFVSSHFSGSDNCASCHDGLTDTAGGDVSIVRDWGASMMANSTKDPFWQAKVASELERNPHLDSIINDKCTQCHAPMANYEITQIQGDEITLFGEDGVLNPDHAKHDAAMNGVSCTLCHQITDDAELGTLNGFSGQYRINNDRTIYGQYSDIMGQTMINSTGYTPAYSAHISDSAICATCHNLKTPFVDANGNLLTTSVESEFPEQMPYTEWQHSIFDNAGSSPQSCQDCHMPKTTAKVSNRPRWLNAKEGFAKHQMVGPNTVMLTLLRDNAAQLDVTSSDLDLGISRSRDLLQGAARVEILSASVTDGMLEARVRVDNLSGHKAPTSYPSRRMWLHFKVTDSNDNLVFESGAIDADGAIVGADNDIDQTVFEPHYSEITSADQVQIYETVMSDSDGNITYTLLRGAYYLKDNRLTPQGFDKFNVPSDVAVRGLAGHDDDFNLGSDELTYRIPVDATGDLKVSLVLNYQPISHGFLEDLYRDGHLDQVQRFKMLYDEQDLKYEQVATAETWVVSDIASDISAPVLDLSLSPSVIDAGQSATLNWTSSNTDSCTASGDWSGERATNGSEVVSPVTTSIYNLACTGADGSVSDSLVLTVNEVSALVLPTVSLSASPSSVRVGDTITLSWSSSDATSCTASGDWSGTKTPSGSESMVIEAAGNYSITCLNDNGQTNDTVSYGTRGSRWLMLN